MNTCIDIDVIMEKYGIKDVWGDVKTLDRAGLVDYDNAINMQYDEDWDHWGCYFIDNYAYSYLEAIGECLIPIKGLDRVYVWVTF